MKSILSRVLKRLGGEDKRQQIIAVHDYKIIYFPIPKVACSSLKSACVDLLKIQLPSDAWKADAFNTSNYDHLFNKSNFLVKKKDVVKLPNYWSFAFVRNPWDRLVSCYSEKIRKDGDPENFTNGVSKVLIPYGVFKSGMPFSDFARAISEIPDRESDPHFRSQYTFICSGKSCRPMVDFIGRFENLEEDFKEIQKRIDLPFALPHMLASKRNHYRGYYNPALVEIVARRYQKDVEIFSYRF